MKKTKILIVLIAISLLLGFFAVCFSQSTDSRKNPVADDKNYHWEVIGYEIDGDTVYANKVYCDSISYPTVQRFDKGWYVLEVWSYPQLQGSIIDTIYVLKSDMDVILKILELEKQIDNLFGR